MKLAFQRPDDGGVTILDAAPKSHLERVLGPLTNEQYIAFILQRRATPLALADVIQLPDDWQPDKTFRNAWSIKGGKIDVDMPKAREIHRARIRRRRERLLRALDAEYQRADERSDAAEKLRIAARKQSLRDAPADPRIDAAQTPEALKAIDPLEST